MTKPKSDKPTRANGRDGNAAAYIMDDAGHPTALRPEVEANLVASARKGYWPAMCALLNKVAPSTVKTWLEKGLDEYAVNPYRRFAEDFIHAELESCAELEDILRKAALGLVEKDPDHEPPDIAAVRWLLERRYADMWRGGAQSATSIALAATSPEARGVRQKALEFLKSLPEAERVRAQGAGLTLPG
jgi:hypothetical protein